MRAALVGVLLLLSLPSLQSQEESDKHVQIGCSAGAIEANWDRKPPLRMKPIAALPDPLSYEGHEFRFPALGQFVVEIFLTATLPEFANGGPAKLHIYAETIDSADDPQNKHAQWWEVELLQDGSDSAGRSSRTLVFDSARIRNCFTQDEDCGFADVGLATPDPNVPLVAIKFGENLGGANALNWTEASILLDFRPSPPRVSATLDCAYNEGGGACTAFDSAEAPRSELRCEWKGENDDFLCFDNSTDGNGYLDFFLLSDKPAPLRTDEVATLDDALDVFKSKGTASPVKVRGIGPVSWIGEVRSNARTRAIVLGSPGAFHVVTESAGKLGSFTHVEPHPLIMDPNEVSRPSFGIDTPGWTLEKAATFHSRQIFREKDLTVLQVVEDDSPDSRQRLSWLGIEAKTPSTKFDAIQLVGGWHYSSCGNYITPENVLSIGKIFNPFSADVRIQPATWGSSYDESQHGWTSDESGPQDENISNCIRPGKIKWQDGKFTGSIDSGECRLAEEPKNIQVAPDGRIVVTGNSSKSKPGSSH